jgi:diadenosine tetraphosphate (Ap4A) HIT family hydrolase
MATLATCPFCSTEGAALSNALAYARYDINPVSRGHLLIIPRRHVADWFDVRADERQAIFSLADEARARLLTELAPDGFNLGINVGRVAGQTVFHAHLHLIPRYQGDVENPRGGVRGVIPAKQQY